MSGRKTTYTYISDDELSELRRRAATATDLRQSRDLLNRLNEKNEEAIAEYRSRINSMNSNIESLNRRIESNNDAAKKETRELRTQLQNTVRESNERIQQIEIQNRENLTAMQNDFARALSQTRSDLEGAMETNNRRIEEAMERNNRRINAEVVRVSQELREEIGNVREQVNAHIKDEATLLEMAGEYASMAETLNRDTKENYRVDLLCPGRMELVLEQFAEAQNEIRDARRMPANSATARLTARRAMEAALQLHQDVLHAEQEWNLRYQAAKQVLDATELQLEASRELKIPEDGITSRVDVNHWSDGDLARLENRLAMLNERLDMEDETSLRDLDNIQNAGLQISREIDETSTFATEAFYCSQNRAEIAIDVAENLSSRLGLQLVGHGYQGEDRRSAYRIHLRNPLTRLEMTVTQTPVQNEDGRICNRLESDILNYGGLNQSQCDRDAHHVFSAIEELGFEQTPVSTVSGYENRASDRMECANMNRWRNEQQPEVLTQARRTGSQASRTSKPNRRRAKHGN